VTTSDLLRTRVVGSDSGTKEMVSCVTKERLQGMGGPLIPLISIFPGSTRAVLTLHLTPHITHSPLHHRVYKPRGFPSFFVI
jgi:hypothetical protein